MFVITQGYGGALVVTQGYAAGADAIILPLIQVTVSASGDGVMLSASGDGVMLSASGDGVTLSGGVG